MNPPANSGERVVYYSSVADAAFSQALLAGWEREGFPARAVAGLSSDAYRSRPAGRIAAWRRRWAMYGGYAWKVLRDVRGRDRAGRLSVVTTNPFFLPSFVRRLGPRGVPTICLLYDLYPDVLVLAGKIAPAGLAERILNRITRYALRESAATVFLGRQLRRHAEQKFGPARHAIVIPVGADGGLFRDHPPRPLPPGAVPEILYAGAMGHMHEVDTLVELWRTDPTPAFAWRFHSSGAGYQELKRQYAASDSPAGAKIAWEESLPENEWRACLLSCPIALVTLKRGAENLVMPSKTYSALVAGQAILAVCTRHSDLAELVLKHDCGWVVEPGDAPGLATVLRHLAANPAELLQKRQNAYRAGHECYDAAVLAREWAQLFHHLLSPAAPAGSEEPSV
jgi:glycosyltransferase involved in cell wall biosynthesis